MRDNRKPTRFGRAVKIKMLDMGMRQKDLAKAAGLSEPMLVAVIFGDRSAVNWIEPICKELGMDATPYIEQKSA